MMSYLPRTLLLLAAGALLACASTTAEGQPDYAQQAEENLSRGEAAFQQKNYAEAEQYFEYVRAKYPYLDAAKEAELRLADTAYEREQYIEARDAYQNFIKLHPTYPKVDYAAFRAAETHFKAIPSDLFFLPPSYEKDQTEVKNALRAMQDFVRQYPKSEYVPKAKEVIDDARKRLAQHEMYVAGFYKKRERWQAVATRLQTVANDYKGLGYDEEALFGLYDAYTKLNQPDNAKKALEELVSRMPGTPAAEKAKALLGKS